MTVRDRDWRSVYYLTVVPLVSEGRGDAVLDRLDPGLSQLLRVGLHHAAPVGRDVRVSVGTLLLLLVRHCSPLLLLGRGNHFETEAALDVLAVFDCAQSQVFHHHSWVVLRRRKKKTVLSV